MTPNDIARARLGNLGFVPGGMEDAARAVARLGAAQAQDYRSALWSLGARLGGGTEASVEAALSERHAVRTWLFRGTLHLVAAEDLRWMRALIADRLVAGSRLRRERLGLDDADFALSRKVLVAALGGGRALNRDAILAKFQEAGLSVADSRGYHLIWRAANDGVICQGPPNGTEQDFVLLDEWVPEGRDLAGEEARAELALRYFSSHGPATLQDFVGWTDLTVREARAGIAAVADALERIDCEGREYWSRPSPSAQAAPGADGILLLPGFDEFMLGYKDRTAALEEAFADRICPGNNGVFAPTVVSGGRVIGTWKRDIRKKTVKVTAAPFRSFDEAERAGIAEAAARYARFLGLELIR